VPFPKEQRCTRCWQTFDGVESLEQHTTRVHGSPVWHLCHLCADGFSTGRQLERHVEVRHCGKAESSHAYVCALCAESGAVVSFTVQGLLTKHLVNLHGVPRIAAANLARAAGPPTQTAESPNSTDVPNSPAGSVSEPEPPVKRLFVRGETTCYQCSRCDYSAEDRAEFVRHAAEHSPTVAGAVQCKECAAAFTVAPALYRHLRVVHRIDQDIDTYLRENGISTGARCLTPDTLSADEEPSAAADRIPSSSSSATSSGGRSGSSRPAAGSVGKVTTPTTRGGVEDDDDAPAECTVCYRVFLTKQLLRAHMRVHGMVFIQRSRRRLAPTASEVDVPTT